MTESLKTPSLPYSSLERRNLVLNLQCNVFYICDLLLTAIILYFVTFPWGSDHFRHLPEPTYPIFRTYCFSGGDHKWAMADPGLIEYTIPLQSYRLSDGDHLKQATEMQRDLRWSCLQSHFSPKQASSQGNVSLMLREVSFASTCRKPDTQRTAESKGRRRMGESQCSGDIRKTLGSCQVRSHVYPWASQVLEPMNSWFELAFLSLKNQSPDLLAHISIHFNSTNIDGGPIEGQALC